MRKKVLLILACLCMIGAPIDTMAVNPKKDAKFIEKLNEYVYYANLDYRGKAIDEYSTFGLLAVSEELRAIIMRIIVNEDKMDMSIVEAHQDIVKASLIELIPKDVKHLLKQMNWSYIYSYMGDTSYKVVDIQVFWYDL